jgi:hypothetical protein
MRSCGLWLVILGSCLTVAAGHADTSGGDTGRPAVETNGTSVGKSSAAMPDSPAIVTTLCRLVAGGYWREAFNEVERYLDAVDRGYRQQPPGINLRRVKDLLYQVVCQKRTEELVPMYLELGMVNEAMRARDTYMTDPSR